MGFDPEKPSPEIKMDFVVDKPSLIHVLENGEGISQLQFEELTGRVIFYHGLFLFASLRETSHDRIEVSLSSRGWAEESRV